MLVMTNGVDVIDVRYCRIRSRPSTIFDTPGAGRGCRFPDQSTTVDWETSLPSQLPWPRNHACPAPSSASTLRTRILTAARQLFAESGYDRTTIRAIATAARTDPGLVMRYFGSKEALFTRVAQITTDGPLAGSPEQVAELLLASLSKKLRAEPVGTTAMLRSMLTHPMRAKRSALRSPASSGRWPQPSPGTTARSEPDSSARSPSAPSPGATCCSSKACGTQTRNASSACSVRRPTH